MNLNSTERRGVMIPANPLINRLRSVAASGGETASYRGVYLKCLLFVGMTLAGVLLAVYFAVTGAITVDPLTDELFVDKTVVLLLLIAAAIFIVFPFLAALLRVTIPVTGSLYCISVGFLFAFFALLDVELGSYIILALGLTLAVVAVMGFLFAKGIITVTARFRAVTTTAFATVVIGGALLFALSFVPFLRECITQVFGDPIVYFAGSVLGLIIAILFLLVDFENIREMVEERLPKKCEWFASFALAFTVVWIYLKILHIILQIKDSSN